MACAGVPQVKAGRCCWRRLGLSFFGGCWQQEGRWVEGYGWSVGAGVENIWEWGNEFAKLFFCAPSLSWPHLFCKVYADLTVPFHPSTLWRTASIFTQADRFAQGATSNSPACLPTLQAQVHLEFRPKLIRERRGSGCQKPWWASISPGSTAGLPLQPVPRSTSPGPSLCPIHILEKLTFILSLSLPRPLPLSMFSHSLFSSPVIFLLYCKYPFCY